MLAHSRHSGTFLGYVGIISKLVFLILRLFFNFYVFIFGCTGPLAARGLSLVVAVCGLLIVLASLVEEHTL